MFERDEIKRRLRELWLKNTEITVAQMAKEMGIFELTLRKFVEGKSKKNSMRTVLRITAWLENKEQQDDELRMKRWLEKNNKVV